jgi:hypothetical protein
VPNRVLENVFEDAGKVFEDAEKEPFKDAGTDVIEDVVTEVLEDPTKDALKKAVGEVVEAEDVVKDSVRR